MRAATAGAARARTAATVASGTENRRNTKPPSARGSVLSDGRRSSDSGRPPVPPSQPGRASGTSAREHLPSQRRDRSGLAPDSLTARRLSRRRLASRAMARSRAISLWLPVIAWAALIFALSSVPHLSSGLGTWDLVLRKCAHATEYAVLGHIIVRAVGREQPSLVK